MGKNGRRKRKLRPPPLESPCEVRCNGGKCNLLVGSEARRHAEESAGTHYSAHIALLICVSSGGPLACHGASR